MLLKTDFLPLGQWHRVGWLLQDIDSLYDQVFWLVVLSILSFFKEVRLEWYQDVFGGIGNGIELYLVTSFVFIYVPMLDEKDFAKDVVKGGKFNVA